MSVTDGIRPHAVHTASAWSLAGRVWLLLTGAAVAYWAFVCLTADPNYAVDGYGYYSATADSLYDQPVGATGAFLYSPAIFQLMEPLRRLGFDGFLFAMRALELPALVFVAGPLLPLTLVGQLPVSLELLGPNVQLLMTAAIVAGFRFPAAWSFVLLTKVTPGVGLLWFVVRREWRKAAIALGATAAIVGVSFVIAPGLWFEWIGRLTAAQTAVDSRFAVPLPPLGVRLVLAAVLITWGALTNRRWTMYVGTFLALPVPWISGLVLLIPAIREAISGRARLASFSR